MDYMFVNPITTISGYVLIRGNQPTVVTVKSYGFLNFKLRLYYHGHNTLQTVYSFYWRSSYGIVINLKVVEQLLVIYNVLSEASVDSSIRWNYEW